MIYTLTLNPAIDKEYRVDHIQFNEVLRASQMRVDFGGKGFNVSRMLTVLGVQDVFRVNTAFSPATLDRFHDPTLVVPDLHQGKRLTLRWILIFKAMRLSKICC